MLERNWLLMGILKAADRRDRLIYVLSQINAARGDDGMAMEEDDSSSASSEAEVSLNYLRRHLSFDLMYFSGGGVLLSRVTRATRESPLYGRVLLAQVGISPCLVMYVCVHSTVSDLQSSKESRSAATGS